MAHPKQCTSHRVKRGFCADVIWRFGVLSACLGLYILWVSLLTFAQHGHYHSRSKHDHHSIIPSQCLSNCVALIVRRKDLSASPENCAPLGKSDQRSHLPRSGFLRIRRAFRFFSPKQPSSNSFVLTNRIAEYFRNDVSTIKVDFSAAYAYRRFMWVQASRHLSHRTRQASMDRFHDKALLLGLSGLLHECRIDN